MHVGRDEPQFRLVPAAIGTSGPEAVELAESTGVLTLQPYQRAALSDALGEVRSADGQRRFAAFEVALWAVRQIGKGVVLEARALAGVQLFGERRIVWTAHRLKTVADALDRMRRYYDSSDDLRRQVKRVLTSHVDMAIELYGTIPSTRLTELRRIEFHTRTKHAARGLAGDCVFLDEAYGVTRMFTGALIPIMGTRNDPQIWYTSTPPLADSVDEMRADPETAGGQVMYDLRARAVSDNAAHEELCYIDWGPEWWLDDVEKVEAARRQAGRPPIRKDPQLWCEHNPSIGRLQRIEQVAREARAMSLRQFSAEKLGAWPSPPRDAAVVRPIPEVVWAACADVDVRGDEAMAPQVVVVAADAAPGRAWASVVVYGLRPDGVGQVEVVDRRAGTAWVAERLAELRDTYDPLAVVVSSRGPLASSLDAIKEAGVSDPADRPADERAPRRGDLLVTNLAQDAAATAQFIDAAKATAAARDVTVEDVTADVEVEELVHLDDPRLNAAVAVAVLRDVGDGAQAWGRRSSPDDISSLYAASLARWGFQQRRGLLDAAPLTAEQIIDSIR